MSAWSEVSLAEIATPVQRTVAVVPGQQYRTIGVKWWGEGAYERETIDGSRTAAKTLSIVRTDDLIINKIWVRHGSTAVATSLVDGCAASGEFPTFQLRTDRVLPQWIHWQTKTRGFWAKCDSLSRGTSGKNRIKPELFLTIRIPLPPLAEQRRVVARIEELAAQIHEARTLRQQAAEEADALARATIERRYQQLRSKFGATKLSDLCVTITDGDHNTPHFTDSGVRFIFVGNVSSGRLHFENSKRVSEEYYASLKSHRLPERGDILYSAVGATLGIPAVVESDEPFCFQRHVAIIKPDHTKLESRYGWHMLRSRTVTETAWSSTTGSAQPTVPLRAIRELSFPVPSLSDQRRIVAELDALQAEVDRLKRLQSDTAAELDALLPAILDRAFKGELVRESVSIATPAISAAARATAAGKAQPYLIRFIPALLRAVDQPVSLDALNAAVALVFLPREDFLPVIERLGGPLARAHFERFTHSYEDGAFLAAIQTLRRTGTLGVSTDQHDRVVLTLLGKLPPITPEIEADARHLAPLVPSIPPQDVAPMLARLRPARVREVVLTPA